MIPESFKAHIVFEKLEQLEQILSDENAKEKIEIEKYSFYETFISFINNRLKLCIPTLIQDAELSNLANEIEAGKVQINSFLGNNNVGHLQNAVNNFNSALNRAKNLPLILSKGDFDFSKEISIFQETVNNAYKELDKQNKRLETEQKSIQKNLSEKEVQISDIHQLLQEKEKEIQNFLTSYKSEFETIKTNNHSIFEAEKKKFNDLFESDRKTHKEEFETQLLGNKEVFDERVKSFDGQSSTFITELKLKLEEANKIVNIVGNVGVTGNFQKIANQNKKTADSFRWIALAFMIMMSGLLIWAIIELSHGEFNPYKSLVRILAAAVLTYPAVYAAKESNKHRKLETKNRNLELELASIGPFIELLPEEKKQTIKEELVKKYFGNHLDVIESKEDDDISINGLEKIFKAILPFIKR